MIGVIVPFSRPQMAENVLANYCLQNIEQCVPLIIVENGPGVGGWLSDTGHVVRSQHGRCHARTAGLRKARELGCEWFAFWDDDDWYRSGYLEFMWRHRELADVIGLCQHVFEEPSGKRWFIRAAEPGPLLPESEMMPVCGLGGATLFGRLDRALDWDGHQLEVCEEVFWCTDMHRAGRTLHGLADPCPAEPLFVAKRYADEAHGHAPIDWERSIKALGEALSHENSSPELG